MAKKAVSKPVPLGGVKKKMSPSTVKNEISRTTRRQPKVGNVTTIKSATTTGKVMTQRVRPGLTTVKYTTSKPVPLGGVKKKRSK